MNKKETLKQICKMISSGDIPKEIYNKYLSNTPVGFMNYKELCNFFEIGDSDTNFMNFENLNKLVKEHKKETIPYKNYEFDSISYTLLLIDINNLLKENQELKKQLEESKNPLKGIFAQVNDDTLLRDCGAMQSEIDRHKTQQKEFIKYLEDEIKRINSKNLDIGELNLRLDDIKFTQYLIYKEILQKYKSIIGDDKE